MSIIQQTLVQYIPGIIIAEGQIAWTTPGVYIWSPPTGATSISAVCVGGGGGASGMERATDGGQGFGGGGGGGGYSGGGAGLYTSSSIASGGGGGSFNAGTNQVNISGANAGPGYITITKLS